MTNTYTHYIEDCSRSSYDDYVKSLDEIQQLDNSGLLNEGIISSLTGLTGKLAEFISIAKKTMGEIVDTTKLDVKDIIKAFKNKEVFNVLKKFGFSIKKIFGAYSKALKLINGGLGKVFKKLHNSKVFQKIHDGTMKVDEVLKEYPILKKIGGVAVAGLLVWIWLNMSFTGVSLDFDINQGAVLDALSGNYSLADLFSSPDGLKTLSFLALGLSGMSVTGYLGSTAYNLTVSIIYTALQKSNFKDGSAMDKIKKKVHQLAEHKILSFSSYLQEKNHKFWKMKYGKNKEIIIDAESFDDALVIFTRKTGLKSSTIKSSDLVESII